MTMLGTLVALAEGARHPDAYCLDARPIGPRIMVVHSPAGLQAMAEEPALDKGATDDLAVAIAGEVGAYEAIMGRSQGEPRYHRQIETIHGVIKRRQRGLRGVVEARVSEHFAPPCEFSLRAAQHFAASVILGDIFPARAWSDRACAEFVDALEVNALVLGPATQRSAMGGEGAEQVLRRRGVAAAAARYERLYSGLAEEERACPNGQEGLLTTLERAGLRWSDIKAVLTTLISASYETVATSLTELLYQLTAEPALWRRLAASEGEERRRLVRHALYEAVRIIDPLPILLRRAERRCTLQIGEGEGARRIDLDAGQLVLGLLARPLLDPRIFPEPLRMRLDLSAAQVEVIRLAWGLRAKREAETTGGADRFCKGFAYSVTMLSATLEALLHSCEAPTLLADGPIQMYGTRSRRRFRARLGRRRV